MKLIFICILGFIALATSFDLSQEEFSGMLFETILDQELSKNFVISPTSIYTCLGLAYLGAESTTADELKKVLMLEGDTKKEIARTYKDFLRYFDNYTDNESFQFKIANRFYVNQKYKIKPKFNEMAKKYFRATAESIDFGNSENAAAHINSWISEQTKNKIQNVITPNSIDNTTSSILVNAVYFKGQWMQQFKVQDTRKQDFFLGKTEKKPVDMMFQDNYFRFADLSAIDATALKIPYIDPHMDMVIILPNEVDGLRTVQEKLKDADISEMPSHFSKEKIALYLPKINLEYQLPLNDVLSKLGIKSMFSSNANFSSLVRSEQPLPISKLIQNTHLEINEYGTEAGAPTDFYGAKAYDEIKAMRRSNFEFRVNRPFMFYIRNGDTIALTGQFYNVLN